MSGRRLTLHLTFITVLAIVFFGFGRFSTGQVERRALEERDAQIEALRAEVAKALSTIRENHRSVATGGTAPGSGADTSAAERALLVTEVKRQIQTEMGLLPLQMLRERRRSFVELYAYDNRGRSSYGTAGYLGDGYFITVKHGVQILPPDPNPDSSDAKRIVSVKLAVEGKLLRADVIDAGDADIEVHSGDWAVLRVGEQVDLPALSVNTGFPFDFAEPITRMGNDYSKGIILSTGYVGQRTSNGLVTCLTDGHPGVSGGGVLDMRGDLVGIPVGRMQNDFRFSFILPLRPEMFRKVPGLRHVAAARGERIARPDTQD
ncbi:MAG: serine protease [Vicinamibacterales bacterium]